jgi:hypothetical protein
LEHISWRVLDEYPEVIRRLIRTKSGIYALYRGHRLYYVGLADNLMGRLKGHLRDRHRGLWDRFSVYLTVDSSAIGFGPMGQPTMVSGSARFEPEGVLSRLRMDRWHG